MFSEKISEFIRFLREACQEYNIAVSIEKEADYETQDILHKIEFDKITYHEYAKLSKGLAEVRRKRRDGKDKRLILEPLVKWISENSKLINEMERLLGETRKIEKQMSNRIYLPRTDVVDKTLSG